MFKHLRQQNTNNKTPTKNKYPIGSHKTPSKIKQRSYSAMLKQKKNGSEIYDYELASICDHLYQGQFYNNKKYGEGIVILNNGVTVVGNWKNGWLHGTCLFFTPFGGKIYCSFSKGQLYGWAFISYDSNIEINKFQNDRRDPIRSRFDSSENLWVQSLYRQDGKLMSIIKIQSGKIDKLPSFLKVNEELCSLYGIIMAQKGEFLVANNFNKIKHMQIGQFQYFGYLNTQAVPQGLGIIYSSSEIYAGNFHNGSLNIYGLILFSNGLLYKGQIMQGKIEGVGIMYDPYLDQTKFVKSSREGVQNVISEEDGFDITNVPFNIGKTPKSDIFQLQSGFEGGIQEMCEEIARYYYKQHSQYEGQSTSLDNYVENFDNSIHNEQSQKKNNKIARKPILQMQFGNQSLDEQVQQISNPKSILGLPMRDTPTFDLITRTKSNKIQYPHLKEFEVQKKINFIAKPHQKPGMIYQRSIKRKIV